MRKVSHRIVRWSLRVVYRRFNVFSLTNISTATMNSVLCHVRVNIVTGSVFNVLSRVPFRSTTVAFNALIGKRKQQAIYHDANNPKNCLPLVGQGMFNVVKPIVCLAVLSFPSERKKKTKASEKKEEKQKHRGAGEIRGKNWSKKGGKKGTRNLIALDLSFDARS